MSENNQFMKSTSLGDIIGNRTEEGVEFLGVPYAKARRFEYASPVRSWEGILDATKMGKICP
ncbi:MAG: carboxylesterase family protein, partial [Erysipelotrichales bacterium]|nr:carboxylesterase family protein [Erysipelotrichales bacterium]